jgi:ubiquinone/menaquinone biosynthesis C-methylase UbiE
MGDSQPAGRRGDYGYDAPYALVAFAAIAALCLLAAIAAWIARPPLALALAPYGVFFAANATSFYYTTRRGKFLVWEDILNELEIRGDERVLDMGCGRGAVLVAVARRLKTGRVAGVDLWSSRDQSGNSRAVTQRNATLEGVQELVDIATGDMRALPFGDATFDIVVSSLAIHNIPSQAGRRQAIAEAWRVLKPGGRLALADIRATAVYARTLTELGAGRVTRRGHGWRFWYGNPMASTSLVRAEKASTPSSIS